MLDYKGVASSFFGSAVDKYPQIFQSVKENLPKSGIKTPFRTYSSTIMLTTFAVYFLSLIFFVVAFQIMEITMLMRIVYTLFIPVVLAMVAFAVMLYYPSYKGNERNRSIEVNLPFVLTHMGSIAESGIPPYVIFKLIGNFEEYGEIAIEMRKIVRNIDVFGLDPISAVREVAKRTPSEELRQVLMGFVTTTESGGDVKVYLRNAGQQALFEWRQKREKFLQQLSAYAEFYVGILIAAPLFIISLFSVMNLISPNIGGFNLLFLMKLSIYALIPVLNIAFLLFMRGVEVEM